MKLLLTQFVILFIAFSFSISGQDYDVCEAQGGYDVEVSGTPTACEGSYTGQATVGSTGCSCIFSNCVYEWSDGQTFHTAYNLKAGTYSVTIGHKPDSLDNRCYITVEVVIEDGDEMIESVEQTEISCADNNDASITLNPSVFAGQLSYEWSNGETTPSISNLSAGSYTVSVSNFENCTEQIDIQIPPANSSLTIDNISSLPACENIANGKIELSVSATNNYTVQAIDNNGDVYDNLAALNAGDYEVIVTDENGCSANSSIIIAAESVPDLNIIYNGELQICNGEFKNVVASVSEATSYVWEPTTGVSGTNAVYLSPTETTTYTVTASLPNGCSVSEEITIEVENCGAVAVNDIDVIDNIYPNPSQGIFNLTAKELINSYAVYNITGKLIQQTEVMNNTALINLENKPAGIYFLNVNTDEGTQMVKLLKR